jgi:hypothetical protein
MMTNFIYKNNVLTKIKKQDTYKSMKEDILSDEFLNRIWNEFIKKSWKGLDKRTKSILFVTIILNLIATLFLIICFSCNHNLTVDFMNQLFISFFCFVMTFAFSIYSIITKRNILGMVLLIISIIGILFWIIFIFLIFRFNSFA